MAKYLFISLLVAWSLYVAECAPTNKGRSEFISLVPEGSGDGTPCGYRWFGPGELQVNFETIFKPKPVAQWVNGTVNFTAGSDFTNGYVKADYNVWPFHTGTPLCDNGHGEEYCPLLKGERIVVPVDKYLFPYYLIPNYYNINITAFNDKDEMALRIEFECTIHPAGRFPIVPNIKKLRSRWH